MKSSSLVGGIQGVALCVLADVQCLLGYDDQESARDYERFRSLVETRGLAWLTLDLPELGKIFDRSLSEGALPKLSIPGFGKLRKGTTLPLLFGELWLAVFDEGGQLREEPCIATIACLRQIFFCLKKARLDCDPSRIAAVFDEFKLVDQELREPSLNWDDPTSPDNALFNNYLTDGCSEQPRDSEIMDGGNAIYDNDLWEVLNVVQYCYDIVSSRYGIFDPLEWNPKHGAGAVADARRGKEYKYAFPNWSARLESVFPLADIGYANYSLWGDDLLHNNVGFEDREVPSRLITVPKEMKGPRLIASEPISNQFCQQAILRFLVNKTHNGILNGNINFHDQELSRVMALSASADRKYATIDLKHASDSVSCWLVERFWNKNRSVLSALMASRTSSCLFPSGEIMNLKKFTTMGAATTFPIQTILFAATCIAVECWSEGGRSVKDMLSFLKRRKGRSRVFGDDLIVPTDSAKTVIKVLNFLGFEVNLTKSFTEGNFREACGIAAYKGTDVTQTYVYETFDRARPSSLASVRECSNNLHLAGYWNTAAFLASTVPPSVARHIPVVQAESGRPGWASFVGSSLSGLVTRYNEDLQRVEVRTVDVVTSTDRTKPGGSGALLQFILEAPEPSSMVTWEHGFEQRPRLLVKSRWEDILHYA